MMIKKNLRKKRRDIQQSIQTNDFNYICYEKKRKKEKEYIGLSRPKKNMLKNNNQKIYTMNQIKNKKTRFCCFHIILYCICF
jgi:hypothetical protein